MKLTPATIDLLDNADMLVSTDVDLPAGIDEVWAVIADNSTWTEWFDKCKSVTATPTVWTDAGQTRSINVGGLKVDEIAVQVDQPNRWAMTITKSNLPLGTSLLEVLDLADTSRQGEVRTEVRWTGAFLLPAYFKPWRGLIQSRMVAAWSPSLETLLDAVIARR